MKMTKIATLLAALVLVAAAASAQPVTGYTLRVYTAGTNTIVAGPTVVPVASIQCNVDPTTIVANTVNPVKALWTDTVNAGKVCVYTDPGSGPLSTTPFGGNYEATATASNSAGESPESNRAPFTHPGVVPPVLTGFKVGR